MQPVEADFLYYQTDENRLKMAFKYQSKAFANPEKITIFV